MSDTTIPGADLEATRAYARDYMERGWAVLLLGQDSSGRKTPFGNCLACDWGRGARRHDMETCGHLMCHGFYAATTDPNRFDEMLALHPNGYLAIRTGHASHLLVIDAEAHGEPTGFEVLDDWEQYTNGVELPNTLTARSVSGGLHLYYRLPPTAPPIRCGRILASVDVKAEKGYVAAVCGRNGREWRGGELVDAPHSLLNWLYTTSRKRVGSGVGSGGSGGYGVGYDYGVFLREGCPQGYRDDFMNDVIFRARKRGLDGSRLWAHVRDVWERVIQQPPVADYEQPWSDIHSKLERSLTEVEPDTDVGDARTRLERWFGTQDEVGNGTRKIGRVTVVRRGRR